jgi:3-dehydroquinate synthase
MLDVTGLAASLVHRGLRLVRIPTTVLAQADAGVGVKNGIDFFGTKNLAGTFAPPFAVLNDPQFLLTLPREDWIGGFSESFKVAIIEDASFFEDLCRLAPFLAARDQDAAETVIRRTAELHLDHIRLQGDPFEFGAARPLDFGHWAAHRIEVLTEYAVGHGTAVALGIALDTCYATGLGLVAGTDRDRILDALEKTGLPTFHFSLLERDANGRLAILQGISDFREHLGGRLHVTLPRGIGARVDVHEMEDGQVEEALCFLKRRNS